MKKDNKKRKVKNSDAIKNRFKVLMWVTLLAALLAWMLFNPYYSFGLHWKESTYIDFLSNFARTINSTCTSANIGYRFSSDDVLLLLRFIECTAFGVVCSNIFECGPGGRCYGKKKMFWRFCWFVLYGLIVRLLYVRDDITILFHKSTIPLYFAYSIGFWSVCIFSWLKSKDKAS